MFDKLKEAVSDVLGGHADDAQKTADNASAAVGDAQSQAAGAVNNVTGAADQAGSGGLSGLTGNLPGGLGGMVDQLGGVGQLKDVVSGLSYPVNKDEVVAKLQESGVMDKVVEMVKQYGGDRFNSPEEILGVVKGFLGK